MDLEAGLPEAVKLTVGSWTHYQKLDYEHLPFKCRNCQEHGHFQRYCPKLTAEKEDAEGWQKVKKGKISSNTKSKEKTIQEPPKEGNSMPNLQETSNEAQNPTNASKADEAQVPQGPTDPIPHPVVSSQLKEHIS